MTRPSRWWHPSGWGCLRTRDPESQTEVERYYRRLVAYYIGKARKWMHNARACAGLALDWAIRCGDVEGNLILSDERVTRCCTSIRRLRAERDQLRWELDAAREALREQLEAQSENLEEAKAEAWHEAIDELATIHNMAAVDVLRSRYPRPEKEERREKPPKACETCQKWERNSPTSDDGMCLDEQVKCAMRGADVEYYEPRADFCCNRHEEKEQER